MGISSDSGSINHRPIGLRNSICLSWLDFADVESLGTDFPGNSSGLDGFIAQLPIVSSVSFAKLRLIFIRRQSRWHKRRTKLCDQEIRRVMIRE